MLHGTWIFTYIWFKITGKCRYAGKYSSPIRRIWDIQTLIASDPSWTSYVYIYIYLELVCPLFWGLNPPKEGLFQSKLRVIIWVLGIIYIYIFIFIYIYMISRKSLEESGGIYWEVSKNQKVWLDRMACFCGGSDFLQSYLEKGFLPPIDFWDYALLSETPFKTFNRNPVSSYFWGLEIYTIIYSYLGDEQRPSGPWSFAVYGGLHYPCYTRLMISSWSPWLVGFFWRCYYPGIILSMEFPGSLYRW